jgi:hypothetical protein
MIQRVPARSGESVEALMLAGSLASFRLLLQSVGGKWIATQLGFLSVSTPLLDIGDGLVRRLSDGIVGSPLLRRAVAVWF